jgi:hypothetical protein
MPLLVSPKCRAAQVQYNNTVSIDGIDLLRFSVAKGLFVCALLFD